MKKLVLFIVSLALFVSPVNAEEGLTLSIGGELMERDMPQDIEEAKEVIRYLVDIANRADEQIEKSHNQYISEIENYKRKNEFLETKLENLESKLNEVSEANSGVKTGVNSVLKQNNRCTFLFGVGPIIGSDLSLGLNLNALASYRILRNVQVGAEVFSYIYQNTNLNGAFGIGLVIGYSIY